MHFHKEDRATTHKSCPGRNIVKSDLVSDVEAKIAEMHGGEHAAETVKATTSGKSRAGVVNTDDLNVRSEPSARSPVVATLDKGAKVTITSEARNGDTLWLQVAGGFVSAKFVDYFSA